MKTKAIITITCAVCSETLDLYYSQENLTSDSLPEDIKHDATMASDWWTRDDIFYCDGCWQELEREREAIKSHSDREMDGWRSRVLARKSIQPIPYASAIRDNLNGEG